MVLFCCAIEQLATWKCENKGTTIKKRIENEGANGNLQIEQNQNRTRKTDMPTNMNQYQAFAPIHGAPKPSFIVRSSENEGAGNQRKHLC